MVVITQLVYIHPGKERVFDAFEAVAIPLISRHGGELLLRLRPTPEGVMVRDYFGTRYMIESLAK